MPGRRDSAGEQRLAIAQIVRATGEFLLLFLVALAPWPFASVQPAWETALTCGITSLVVLWIIFSILTKNGRIRFDGISLSLIGLMALSLLQLAPLPKQIVGKISPQTAAWKSELLPERLEQLPGEAASASTSGFQAASVDPYRTRQFLSRMASLFLLYMVVVNWLSTRESFQRLAWVLAVNGTLLAILALAQMLSSQPNVVFWRVVTEGSVFGPFVCKNHYPDYLFFCLGMIAGLFKGGKRNSPHRLAWKVGLVSMFILMLVSLPFSMSRGGVLAAGLAIAATVALVARIYEGTLGIGLWLAFVVCLVLAVGGWFGWERVEKRFATLANADAAGERWTVWRDSSRLILPLAAVGSGNGSFSLVEPLARTAVESVVEYEYAHNEYLEAAVEGGLPRFGLTLLMVGSAIGLAFRASRRLIGRSSGLLALGSFFALTALAIHSFSEFGIHMPAVAFVAVVVAAHVSSAARDPGYRPQRFRIEADGRIQDYPQLEEANREVGEHSPVWFSGMIFGILGILAAAVSWEARSRAIADRGREIATPPSYSARSRLEAARLWIAATPTDAIAHLNLAHAHFQANQIPEGLAAARTARGLSPLLPEPHARLGRYVKGFVKSEPARVHFERAKRLLPVDPYIRFACAVAALEDGDRDTAFQDFREAVRWNSRLVSEVIQTGLNAGISLDELLEKVLPGPVAAMTAADLLGPRAKAIDRQRYLETAARAKNIRSDWACRDWIAIARACGELNRDAEAEEAWKKALETANRSEQIEVHDQYAQWLEANERYDDARVELLWLRANAPQSVAFRDRLETVKHAMQLKQIIEGN